ncbi:PREDICTED: pectinesterase inhibitor-like [Camelina sativa]|uniref:Pectinesterase inhibitor-like n=1 Tax=Camelina sativa TaxID=90675 RepID=A0ABM0WDW0_CAMSA|nr:PREDICTED: pectinesterase inhibitor-like [Camelina sativa]
MAVSGVRSNVFSFLPLLLILSITPLSSSSSFSPSDKVTKALLDKLCSQPSIYKHFCIPWLTSDPTTFTLDLKGLVPMVFQKAEMLGYKNLAMIEGLYRTTNDPTLKIPYGSCMTGYEFSNKALKKAKQLARSNAYVSASKAAFKGFDSIGMCESLLEGLATPADVSKRNMWYERMCNTGMAFFDILAFGL